jgi:hypothetical protein
MIGRERVGKEDGFMKGIGRRRIDCVGRKNDQDEDERVYPGMFERDLFPFPQKGTCFPSLRIWPECFFMCLGFRSISEPAYCSMREGPGLTAAAAEAGDGAR